MNNLESRILTGTRELKPEVLTTSLSTMSSLLSDNMKSYATLTKSMLSRAAQLQREQRPLLWWEKLIDPFVELREPKVNLRELYAQTQERQERSLYVTKKLRDDMQELQDTYGSKKIQSIKDKRALEKLLANARNYLPTPLPQDREEAEWVQKTQRHEVEERESEVAMLLAYEKFFCERAEELYELVRRGKVTVTECYHALDATKRSIEMAYPTIVLLERAVVDSKAIAEFRGAAQSLTSRMQCIGQAGRDLMHDMQAYAVLTKQWTT